MEMNANPNIAVLGPWTCCKSTRQRQGLVEGDRGTSYGTSGLMAAMEEMHTSAISG